jgi:hypothetical protein
LLAIILIIVGIFFSFLHGKVNGFIFFFGLVIAKIQVFSYIYTAIMNPGLPKREYENLRFTDENKNYRICKDCRLWINTDAKTFHCYECEVCVEGRL